LAPPPHALRPGVIWKGDTLIDGVPETLDYLRSKARAARALLSRRCAGSGAASARPLTCVARCRASAWCS
jgi:hypothetical protein